MSRFTKRRKKQREVEIVENWDSIYQLPLHMDEYGCYVWCANDVTALSGFDAYDEEDAEKIKHIVDIINGDVVTTFEPKWDVINGCDITYDKMHMFTVRGWGHLTGIGALHLPTKVAAAVQDKFIEHILSRLNGENN